MGYEFRGRNYDSKTDAKAVFSSPSLTTGVNLKLFYFEVKTLTRKWNFSYKDGTDRGSELIGAFYYNRAFFDETPEQPIVADFCVLQERENINAPIRLYIKFYPQGPKDEENLLCEFLATDSGNVSSGFEGRDDRLTGEWNIVHDKNLEELLREKYKGREISAKALFYGSGAQPVASLHLTVGREWAFSYNSVNPPDNIPGLPGHLFYNEGFFDKEIEGSVNAKFLVEKKEGDVLIKFYKPRLENEVLGEFLAADPDDKSKGLLGEYTGKWKHLPGPNLFEELRRKYGIEETAQALVHKGTGQLQSFRFNCFRTHWEFADNTVAIGHRIFGSLFYNHPILSDDAAPIGATFDIERKRVGYEYYALVKFYKPDAKDQLWGEFLASDKDNRVGEAGLLKKGLEGRWKIAQYQTFDAIASKQKDSPQITLSFKGAVAKIECKTDDEFHVKGSLTSKSLMDHGKFVHWHEDRAVFHKDRTTEDFAAYFFPKPSTDEPDNKEVVMIKGDVLDADVTWKFQESPEEE